VVEKPLETGRIGQLALEDSMTGRKLLLLAVLFSCSAVTLHASQLTSGSPVTDGPAAVVTVPRVIKFSGVLSDSLGKPLTGTQGVTFALYKDQQGGSPLWLEQQNVVADDQGRYGVLLGATKSDGIPQELFATSDARWLGIQPQVIDSQIEQPRVLLVSVPYALKAADADTIGGKPASAFLLANDTNTVSTKRSIVDKTGGPGPTTSASTTTAGTLAKFDVDGTSLTNSIATENSGRLGINAPTPQAPLQVTGSSSSLLGARNAVQLENNNVFNNSSSAILFSKNGVPLWHIANDAEANGTQSFYIYDNVAGNIGLYISPTGNMGIGTTNPGSRFQLSGNSSTSLGARNALQLDNINPSGNGSNALLLTRNGSARWSLGNDLEANGTQSFYLFDHVNAAVRFYMSPTGNMGLGTFTPTAKLDVVGSAKVSGNMTATSFTGDGSLLSNLTASNIANGTLPIARLTPASRIRGITYLGGCDTCSTLADTDDQKTIYLNVIGPMSFNSVTCYSDVGTPTINIQRGGASPTNILSSDLACSPSGATTSGFAVTTLNQNETLDFVMVTAGGTAHRVTVAIQTTVN
jgi:hypothetical protein